MRLLVFLCCLFPAAVLAQEKKGTRTCRILFLGAAETDPETLHLHDGSGTQEVALPRLNLSRIYRLPAGELTLRMLPAPPEEGRPADPVAPSAKVAAGIRDLYLLVSPDPANKTVPVRLQVIDAAAARFKPGQMLWFNLTAHDVGGRVGKQDLVVKARSRVVLAPPASAVEPFNVNLTFRIAGKDALYPLCETQWHHDPAARTLVFIVNEAGSRTPRVLGFPDHRESSGKNP